MGNEKFVYIIAFMDLFATNLILPVMHPYLGRLGASHTAIGSLMTCFVMLQILGSIIISKWISSKNHSTALQISLLACGISFFIMASTKTVAVIYVCRLIQGAFQHTQLLSGSVSGQLQSQGKQSKLQPLLASYGVYFVMLAIVIACHLIPVPGGYQYVCYFIATVCLTNFSIAYFYVPTMLSDAESKKKGETTKKDKPTPKSEKETKDIMSSALKAFSGVNGPTSDLLALKFILEFALFSYVCNFAPVLWEVYKTAPGWIGYTLGLFILCGVLSRPAAAWIYKLQIKDQTMLALYGFGIYTASFACLFLAPSWIWIIVSMIPLHISNALLTSIVSDLEKQRKASADGADALVVASAKITAPFMSGLTYDLYGYAGASFLRVLVSGTGILIASSLPKKQIQGKKDTKKVK